MSKIKDYLMDLEEVSLDDYPEEVRKEFEEMASYIPVEAVDNGLPF